MVVTDLINTEDFNFCPKCGHPVILRRTLGKNTHDIFECRGCFRTYYIGLAPDYC